MLVSNWLLLRIVQIVERLFALLLNDFRHRPNAVACFSALSNFLILISFWIKVLDCSVFQIQNAFTAFIAKHVKFKSHIQIASFQNSLCQIKFKVSLLQTSQIQSFTVANLANSKFHCFNFFKFKVSLFQISWYQSFIDSNYKTSKLLCVKLRGIFTHYGEAAPNSN